MLVVQVLVALMGIALVCAVLFSALKTVVVPRGYATWITRAHFEVWRWLFNRRAPSRSSYAARDRALVFFAPIALITLPAVWVGLITVGFTAVFWGIGVHSLAEAFATSGSSLFTLGFDRPSGSGRVAVSFVEAGIGLGIVSLMISYLPTIYGAFSRREALVGMLEVRAGSPPSPSELLIRYWRIGWLDRLGDDVFARWEQWFVEVKESHTSHLSLVFFRSQQPDHSWITSAGCVLDVAAITASTVDVPHDARADVMLRSGFLALGRIADQFGIEHPADPAPDDPISVTRAEFDAVCDELREVGVPLREDLDQAWLDFAGWRVNYDASLVGLCALLDAPPSRWSSDRPVPETARRAIRNPFGRH